MRRQEIEQAESDLRGRVTFHHNLILFVYSPGDCRTLSQSLGEGPSDVWTGFLERGNLDRVVDNARSEGISTRTEKCF